MEEKPKISKRSEGITIFAFLLIGLVICSIRPYYFALLSFGHLVFNLPQSFEQFYGRLSSISIIFTVLVYPLFLTSAIAVLKLKEWGRKLIILSSLISLISLLAWQVYTPLISHGTKELLNITSSYEEIGGDLHPAPVVVVNKVVLYVLNIYSF